MSRRILSASFAATVCVLLAVSLVGCKKDKPAIEEDNKPSGLSISADDVAMHASIDVARILREVENRVPPEEKADPAYILSMGVIKGLKLNRVDLYVLSANKTPIPLLVAADPDKTAFNALASNAMFDTYLQKTDSGALRLNSDDSAEMAMVPDELREVIIKSVGPNLVVSTPAVIERLEGGDWQPEQSDVVKLSQQVRTENSLVVVGLLTGKLLELTDKKNNAAESDRINFDIANSLSEELDPLLKTTQAVAIGFAFTKNDGREIRYLQRYDSEDSSRAAETWLAKKPVGALPEKLIDQIRLALDQPKLRKTVTRDGSALSVTLSWDGADDEEVVSSLASATVGSVFNRSMQSGLDSSDGPIVTQYVVAPNLTESVADPADLEKQIGDELSRRLFVEYVFASLEDPGTVQLILDPVFFPNADLATAKHTIKSVLTTDKKDVLNRDDEQFKDESMDRGFPSIEYGANEYRAHIRVPVQPLEPEKLKSATLEVVSTVPTRLAIFRFDAADGEGQFQERDGASVRLSKLDRNVVNLRFTVPAGLRKQFETLASKPYVYAFDDTGGALANEDFFYGGGNAGMRFHGAIEQLWVVLPLDARTVTSTVTVDLRGGQPPEIQETPADDVPVRYDVAVAPAYRSVDDADLADLQVLWNQKQHGWGGLLAVLPEGTPLTEHQWELHWFGAEEAIKVEGNSSYDPGRCEWNGYNGFDNARAVIGRLKVVIPTDLQTAVFEKQANGEWLTQDAGGHELRVRFDKQIVTLATDDGDTLRLRAFDDTGRVLRDGERTLTMDDGVQHYLWGQPTRVEVLVSYRTIEKVVPFEIVHGKVNQAAFAKFKAQTDQVRKAALALKQINAAMDAATIRFDRIAGWYYLFDDDGQPLHAIPQEIAHACPDGAELFEYKTEPYGGYVFGMVEFHQRFGDKQPYDRSSQDQEYLWEKGKIVAKPYFDRPALVAWPEDPTLPTLLVKQWQPVSIKLTNGKPPEVEPDFQELNEQWQSVDFIDDEARP